ncbi:MAG TPA: ATP-binding protein [Hyphomonadaceae bacterium]|nr:ATP-binding protein [Hyphomonadaceae bacterium]
MSVGRGPVADGERLAALFELDLMHGGPFPNLDRLIALAADICNANLAAFIVYDATRAYQVSTSYGRNDTMPLEECMCALPLERGMTVSSPDARVDRRLAEKRYVLGEPYVRSFIGVPVGASADLHIGVLAVGHTDPHRFGPREIERLEKVAELVTAFLAQRREAIRAKRAAAKTEEERQRQHLFELIFQAIQEGVNVHRPNGEVVDANPACLDILGLSADEMAGRAYTDPRWRTFRPDGSSFPVEDYPVAVTLRTGQSLQNVPMGVQLPSGEVRWISINTVPLRNSETDEVEYAVVTMKDITAQREAEHGLNLKNSQLADALAEAEKASRAKSDFMGVMSHELRTPMNAVLSCALLLSQSKLDPVQRRTLGVLEDAGRQMLALLNDLLDLSSLNADKVRIEREPVSLLRLIEDAAVIWAAEIKAKGLSLQVMVDPALVQPRKVDPARLLQIIGNLMANAIKFTSSGGITIQAWPERGKGGVERIAIEVEDTGPGVPKEAVERIFSPFEQADVSTKRRHGGLGLGLHVARRLAVAMGGDIELETRPESGSRFTVRIDAPLSDAPAQRQATPIAANDEGEMQVREVLCIDDNPRNLYVLGAMLRAAGHRTTEAASGAEALAQLAVRKFDVILLDMVMPDMDGLDVLARLRQMGGVNKETPVIACTANVMPDQIETYRNAGTVGVLAKPIDPRAMLMAVATAAA